MSVKVETDPFKRPPVCKYVSVDLGFIQLRTPNLMSATQAVKLKSRLEQVLVRQLEQAGLYQRDARRSEPVGRFGGGRGNGQ